MNRQNNLAPHAARPAPTSNLWNRTVKMQVYKITSNTTERFKKHILKLKASLLFQKQVSIFGVIHQ